MITEDIRIWAYETVTKQLRDNEQNASVDQIIEGCNLLVHWVVTGEMEAGDGNAA